MLTRTIHVEVITNGGRASQAGWDQMYLLGLRWANAMGPPPHAETFFNSANRRPTTYPEIVRIVLRIGPKMRYS